MTIPSCKYPSNCVCKLPPGIESGDFLCYAPPYPKGQRLILNMQNGTWLAMDYDNPETEGRFTYIQGYLSDMSTATVHTKSYTKEHPGEA